MWIRLRIAKTRCLGDLDDQRSNLLRLTLTPLGFLRLLPAHTISAPAIERGGFDNRDQFFDRSTERFAETEQSLALGGRRVHLLPRQPGPKKLVFFLEILKI